MGDLGPGIQRDATGSGIVEQVPQPFTQGQSLLLGGLRFAILRGHEAFFELSHRRLPKLGMPVDRREVGEAIEAHTTLGLASVVTVPAVPLQLRQEIPMEVRGPKHRTRDTQEQQ